VERDTSGETMKVYKIEDGTGVPLYQSADYINHDDKTGKSMLYKKAALPCDLDILVAALPSNYAVIETQIEP
jgi:hypothetical protein